MARNFEKVAKGEVYASRGDKELVAEKGFYPVLMSTNGYEDILGHKASRLDE
jgi:succinylglutamate desuccinylase